MYLTLVAVLVSAVAADTSKYCSLCRPGSASGDRAHHTMCLYQASVLMCASIDDWVIERRL